MGRCRVQGTESRDRGKGKPSLQIYKFLSIFSFYANSNVVVAIGLDRLKVVYTSHIQGMCLSVHFV